MRTDGMNGQSFSAVKENGTQLMDIFGNTPIKYIRPEKDVKYRKQLGRSSIKAQKHGEENHLNNAKETKHGRT